MTRLSWPRTAGCSSARNGGRPRPIPVQRGGPPRRQRLAQHLVDRLDHHELDLLTQVGGDVVEVGLVAVPDQAPPQSPAVCAKPPLLYPAHPPHAPAPRELPPHRPAA